MTFPIPDAALLQHTAILGKTGAGKTTTAKAIIEHVVAENMRVCILDPIKSDWWGLISSKDGKHAGLPFVILGGPRGHVPLHATSGKSIAELVANGLDLPLSILDMADFGPGGQQKFFCDFASTLLKKIRGVLYLVMEEAHLFAPKERSGLGDENMAIHWAKMLATAGRSKGIRLILATQRTQALHNALLGSCDTLVALRMTAPADQKPVLDWLKANASKDVAEKIGMSLSSLKTGDAWVCSGEASMFTPIRFPPLTTYDNTATPTSDTKSVEVKTAAVDLDRLKTIVGDAVAEAHASDPKALRAEIERLKSEIQKLSVVKSDDYRLTDVEIETCTKAGYDTGWAAGVKHAADKGFDARNMIGKALECLKVADQALNGFIIAPVQTGGNYAKPMQSVPVVQLVERRDSTPKAAGSSPAGRANGHLPPGERAVLIAAVQFDGIARADLSIITGYKRSSRDAYIQRLREKGYVEVAGDMVRATKAGADHLPPDYEPLPTGGDLQEYWLTRLPSGERTILKVLLRVYPNGVDRTTLDGMTGYKRSSRDAYLQRMKAKRLWEANGNLIRANEALFR